MVYGIKIVRMNGFGGYDIIGMRVCPTMSGCRVVDRQELDDFDTGIGSPMNEETEVVEIASSK